MLTVICSGPARTRGAFRQALSALGASIVREADRNLGGLPDWPEDADQVVADLTRTRDEALDLPDHIHVSRNAEDLPLVEQAIEEWTRIAGERRDVDVDWIELVIADELLDDVQAAAPRWGWLVRMYGTTQPAGPAELVSAPNLDDIAAAAEERVMARLREQGVI